MNEPLNDPMGGRGGVSEAMAALRQTSFLRVMLVLAATVIVLVGIRLGAPILNPIFFALVLSLLFSPIYSWLKHRGLPPPVVLVIMLIVIGALFMGLFLILGVSISRFSERVGFYTSQLNSQVVSLDALLERLGLSNVDLRDVV
jgi:predicted PurR-regulated permease PerM